MKRISRLILLIWVLTVFTACSQETSNKNDQETQKKEENAVETNAPGENTNEEKQEEEEGEVALPTSYQELASLPVGELDGFNTFDKEHEETLKAFEDLPDVSSNPSNQELDYFYRELLRKVQKEFKGPENLIREMRFQSLGDPEMVDSRYQFKENLNVEIVLDASGSMAQSIGGKTKMDAAKNAILDFVNGLPDEARVGLRVFGHKGSNADRDKGISCSSTELMHPFATKAEGDLKSSLSKITPVGWTPTGLGLKEAQKDLASFDGKNHTNIVYLVSDGVSTCEDQPVEAAKQLYNSNISPIINVIGFDVDAKGQNELIKIADATQGIYQKVNDESELKSELMKIQELAESWEDWKQKSTTKLESKHINNSIDIFSYITGENYNATFERSDIDSIIFVFKENGKLDKESAKYLEQKNKEYHDWIHSEIEKFKLELESLNNKSYKEAIKTLEDKYEQNTQ
jgi:Ca-activated chloride channel family protein